MACDLSIIIVSWNTRDMLRECLASLPAATGALSSEVWVVDNASRDGSASMAAREFPACALIESGANLGFSKASNLALARATGQALLLLNPDTVCPAGSLVRLAECLRAEPRRGVVGPTLIDAEGKPTITYGNFPAARYHWLGCIDPRRSWLPQPLRSASFVHIPASDADSGPVDYVAGACLLISREAYRAVGPLDERFFMYFEETDWCWRAREAGFEVHHCAAVRVTHLEGQSAHQAGDFSLAQFQKSYRLFLAKHYRRGRAWHFRAAQLTEYTLKALLRSLAPGQRARNRALAAAYWKRALLQLRQDIEARPPS